MLRTPQKSISEGDLQHLSDSNSTPPNNGSGRYKRKRSMEGSGDLNIDIKVNSCDSNSSNYLTTLAYHGVLPAHRLPTRDTKCIDHMMLKSGNLAKSAILTNAPTDHSTVILGLMLKPKRLCMQKTKTTVNT
ncbi:unnamed protein product [Euphydryas editha]|uniref:Uncharacterized protein n=1 Tax=Euphydryas editha TaxID=104508 RepID=A0AAU9US78_EUPED|nr:unnamed protein product [Euphydryas editha]